VRWWRRRESKEVTSLPRLIAATPQFIIFGFRGAGTSGLRSSIHPSSAQDDPTSPGLPGLPKQIRLTRPLRPLRPGPSHNCVE
jgi:hypothetical protein